LEPLPGSSLSADVLKDLYYTATDHKESDLAAECARRLYKSRGGDDNRLLLAIALTGAGEPFEALPHLRVLVTHPGENGSERASIEEAYTAALRSAAQHSETASAAELLTELRAFWTAQVKWAGLDEKHRLDLIYGMLEIRAWDDALPLLAAMAQKHGELVPLYVETAVQAGRKLDAISFLKSQLERNDLKPADRETQLYSLIEHGGYDTALPYISRLAWSSGGPWVAYYEDALRKLGRMEELAFITGQCSCLS
jgi:hypothetical protein